MLSKAKLETFFALRSFFPSPYKNALRKFGLFIFVLPYTLFKVLIRIIKVIDFLLLGGLACYGFPLPIFPVKFLLIILLFIPEKKFSKTPTKRSRYFWTILGTLRRI